MRPTNVLHDYDPSRVFLRRKVEALNRVAAELRGMLKEAPCDDPEVAALLHDCDTLEQVAAELNRPINVIAASVGTVLGPLPGAAPEARFAPDTGEEP